MHINKKGKELLSELHEEICATHPGTRAMARKAFRQGFIGP
jgi:hypothetical protein